jgi:DNA adenine methylase
VLATTPDRMLRELWATPVSEEIWNGADAALADADPVRRATAFFIRVRQSRQGLGRDFATLSRNRVRRGMNEQASSWWTSIEGLPEVHERLKRVVILNRDAFTVIRGQDGPLTCFYLDPPYLHSTRATKKDYEYEMEEDRHIELLDLLKGIEGKFLLSGYRSELYDRFAKKYGWKRHDFKIVNNASSKQTKDVKTECVWTNF